MTSSPSPRDLIRTARMPEQLTFSVIMGIFFLLLFYYVFGGVISAGSGVDYIQFLVPGVLVITAVNGAQQTGTGLALDLSTGVVDRFRSLPMSQVAVIAGRTVADTRPQHGRRAAGGGGRPTSWASASSPSRGPSAWSRVVVGLGYAFSWVGAWIGARIRNAETVGMLSMFWLFPLMLASSAFVPTEGMHEFVRLFAEVPAGVGRLRCCSGARGGHACRGSDPRLDRLDRGPDRRVRLACVPRVSSSLMTNADRSDARSTRSSEREADADRCTASSARPWRIVEEEGIAGLSMSTLALRAGVSRQTLYKYFPDIDAVLAGLVALGDGGTAELSERALGRT